MKFKVILIKALWTCKLIILVSFLLRKTPKRETRNVQNKDVNNLIIDCRLNNCAVYRC